MLQHESSCFKKKLVGFYNDGIGMTRNAWTVVCLFLKTYIIFQNSCTVWHIKATSSVFLSLFWKSFSHECGTNYLFYFDIYAIFQQSIRLDSDFINTINYDCCHEYLHTSYGRGILFTRFFFYKKTLYKKL